jgi:1-hydroxycarotenoid 3,4-desaturase
MNTRVVVIGAGFGGLSSALALASRGMTVTILERGPRVGGKAGIETVNGVEFDTGPSLFTMPETLGALARIAAEPIEALATLRSLNPGFRYHYPDGTTLDIHHDKRRTLESVERTFGPQASAELDSFLAYAERIWRAATPPFLYGDAPTALGLLRTDLSVLAQLRHIDGARSMWKAICKRVKHPALRDLLARYATYNGSDVRRAPATLNCIAHAELTAGGFGVQGGMHALAQALAAACTRKGVEIQTGCHVEHIRPVGSAFQVECANLPALPCDAVVCNAEARHLHEHLLVRQAQAAPRVEQPSMSAWTGVFRASPNPLRAPHAVVFAPQYLDEFSDIFDHCRVPSRPTVYACDQAQAHGRRGWGDHAPVFAMINTPALPDGGELAADWSAVAGYAKTRLVEVGVLGEEDPLVWQRTPKGLAEQFPGSQGGIYGAASNSPMSAFHRPGNRVPGFPGVYLASGSAHPGGGVPLAILSGLAAARALLTDRRHPDAPSIRVTTEA